MLEGPQLCQGSNRGVVHAVDFDPNSPAIRRIGPHYGMAPLGIASAYERDLVLVVLPRESDSLSGSGFDRIPGRSSRRYVERKRISE